MNLKKINRLVGICLVCLVSLISCETTTEDANRTIIASVNEEKLYLSDVEPYLQGKSGQDSLQFLENFANKWIITKLVYERALLNINETNELDKKVQEYKEALYIHQYEQVLSNQKLDEDVTEEEIKKYYDKNLTDFKLNTSIVKPVYIEISKEIEDIKDVEKWFKSKDSVDLDKLKEFCFQFSTRFFFAEEWVKSENLIVGTPITGEKLEQIVNSKMNYIEEDSLNYYFCKITDYLPKGNQAPFEFIRKDIETLLIHKKKRNLISHTRNKILQDALDKKKVKIYLNKKNEDIQ